MIIHTEGIVLKTFDYRETSRIATFFTREKGKVSGIMKGVRKNSRKFGSSVDRFSVNDLVYYEYSRSDLHLISHCDLKQYYFQIRQDYNKNVAAYYALELVDAVMPKEHPSMKVYKLLLDFFASLEHEKDINKLIHIFQIKVLLFSGFRPHIDSCVKCGKRISGRARFSMRAGGLVCPACPTRETTFTVVSQGSINSMLYIERHSWKNCLALGLAKSVQKELKFILNNFLVYHLEKRLKTTRFLK